MDEYDSSVPRYVDFDLILGPLIDCNVIDKVIRCEDTEHCIKPGKDQQHYIIGQLRPPRTPGLLPTQYR